jgi:hypothetical protein
MPEEFIFTNGRRAVFEMPDVLKLVAGGIEIPNDALYDVLTLMNTSLNTTDLAADLRGQMRLVRGGYELAALCIVSPKIILPRDETDAPLTDDQMSYRDITPAEVARINNRFLYGIPLALSFATDNGPELGAATAPDGDDLPQSTE